MRKYVSFIHKAFYVLGVGLVGIGYWSCTPKAILQAGSGSNSASETASSSTLVIPKKAANTQAPQVAIEWISPSSADINITEANGKVTIKVRINSSEPIQLSQIDVYVNGKLQGNKADEVALTRRAEFKDQILTVAIPVIPGENAVQVAVTTASDKRYFAERTLSKQNGKITLAAAPAVGNTRVVWITPDAITLRGQMYNTKERELDIRLNITSPEPIRREQIEFLFNRVYRGLSASAQLVGQSGSYILTDKITLQESLDFNEIGIRISTATGYVYSDRVKINYSPVRPNLYVLAIGTQLNLKYAAKDARDFASVFAGQGRSAYRIFSSVTIDSLLGKAATANEIRGTIEVIKSKFASGMIAPDDVVMIFISSHGMMLNNDFCIQGDDYDTNRRSTTSVSYSSHIIQQLSALPCKKVLFLDACHSGGARANATDLLAAIHSMKNAPSGFAILTSSKDSEESHEDEKWQNGAFTEALIMGMQKGMADYNANGIVTLLELEKYLKSAVPQMVQTTKGKPQNPQLTRNEITDLPLYVVKQ